MHNADCKKSTTDIEGCTSFMRMAPHLAVERIVPNIRLKPRRCRLSPAIAGARLGQQLLPPEAERQRSGRL